MQIVKILNNNAVLVKDKKKQECILVGKGLAYGKKNGDTIDQSQGYKVFKPTGKGLTEKLSNILEDIPFEHVKVCNEIVVMARSELEHLDDKIYLTLIDHISFAIERHSKGMEFANSFWEVKRLYPDEYAIGIKALDIIKVRLGIQLPDSEASFIAFHILNANGISTQNARDSVKLIQGVLAIVKSHFHIDLDEESIPYTRFITHLRFFAGRIIGDEPQNLKCVKENKLLIRLLEEMSEESNCVNEIANYIVQEFGHTITKDEKSYLIIHIHSIVNASIK